MTQTPDNLMKHFVKALMKAFIGFLLGMAFYFSILLIYWQFAPYETADVAVPMIVLNENKEVGADRELRLQFAFSKYTNVNPVVARNILCTDDTTHFVFPPDSNVSTARPIGTFTARPVYIVDRTTPINTECYFQFVNEYQVNPIRRITKTWFSEPFIVRE